MTDFTSLLQQGTQSAWLFIPSAILLGALHGLEPGHSKTMMAAFIIAVRGTVWQAILLGISAALSHSFLIWVLAAGALKYGSHWNAETSEPYFQIASGIIVIVTAIWMAWRTQKDVRAAADHDHGDHQDHPHSHPNKIMGPNGGHLIDTGHGLVELSVFETGVPPRFELRFLGKEKEVIAPWTNTEIWVETVRPDGTKQTFSFAQKEQALISMDDIPEPHEFRAELSIGHGGHTHLYKIDFSEEDHAHSGHAGHEHPEHVGLSGSEFQDAHERSHALDIQKRFANREVTTGQIMFFGLSGGLLPCPAAFTVLLLCLQLKEFTLGFTLVLCFSIGLALTMVASGTLAAWSVHHASKRFSGFSNFARKIPYFSSALLTVLGIYMIFAGVHHL